MFFPVFLILSGIDTNIFVKYIFIVIYSSNHWPCICEAKCEVEITLLIMVNGFFVLISTAVGSIVWRGCTLVYI